MASELILTRPDDWHLHLRDGRVLAHVVPHSAERFGRAIVMPNLVPPVTTTDGALAYRDRILAATPAGSRFQPLMTLYLTDDLGPPEIERAHASGLIFAAKLYPAGATTHAAAGVTRLEKVFATLEAMQARDLPLLVHAETADPKVDIFDREREYIDRDLRRIVDRFPALRVVFEHITTSDAVAFVTEAGERVAATVTAHHLLYNRNALLAGGIRPHFYCLPVLKRERHRQALIQAVTSGSPRFFLGTDSAPHPVRAKECARGCAGCYTAFAAIELYAEAFERAGALDRLEAFAGHHGADFYQLPRNGDRIRLLRQDWEVPASYRFGDERVVPLAAGGTLSWKLAAGE